MPDERPDPNPVPGSPQYRKPEKPWWNDGDKVGGIAATILMLGLALVVFSGLVRLAVWIWP